MSLEFEPKKTLETGATLMKTLRYKFIQNMSGLREEQKYVCNVLSLFHLYFQHKETIEAFGLRDISSRQRWTNTNLDLISIQNKLKLYNTHPQKKQKVKGIDMNPCIFCCILCVL